MQPPKIRENRGWMWGDSIDCRKKKREKTGSLIQTSLEDLELPFYIRFLMFFYQLQWCELRGG